MVDRRRWDAARSNTPVAHCVLHAATERHGGSRPLPGNPPLCTLIALSKPSTPARGISPALATQSCALSPLLAGPNSSLGSRKAPVSSNYCYCPSGANGATLTRVRCERLQGDNDTPTACESSYLIIARSTLQRIHEAVYNVDLGKNYMQFQPGEVCAALD